MIVLKWVFPVSLAVLAIVHLVSCWRGDDDLRKPTKIALMPVVALTYLAFANTPSLWVVAGLLLVFFTGLVAANVIGQKLVKLWEALLARIPVVKSIYYSVKQVSDTVFSSSGQAFRKALLVQYPREGVWTIAFLTGQPGGDAAEHLRGDYVSVYVPTTPNPTSGFFLMMRRSEVVELDMSVDDALKYIISMGVVAPPVRRPEPEPVPALPEP